MSRSAIWAILLLLVLVVISCAPQIEAPSQIPTRAELPTTTPLIISPVPTLTPSQTPVPTLTPNQTSTPNQLEYMATRVSQNPTYVAQAYVYYSTQEPNLSDEQYNLLIPTRMWDAARNNLAFEIAYRELYVMDVPSPIRTGHFSPNGFNFDLRLTTDNVLYVSSTLNDRVPFAVCALRDAGYEDETLSFSIDIFREDGRYTGARQYCVEPSDMSWFNCRSPQNTSIEFIRVVDCP